MNRPAGGQTIPYSPQQPTLTTRGIDGPPAFLASAASSASPSASLPRTRFTFECRSPLRKRASLAHASANIDTPPGPNPNRRPTSSQRALFSRRSVPNFLSDHRNPKAPYSQPASRSGSSPEKKAKDTEELAPGPDARPTVRILSPNATKRRKQPFEPSQTPNVKRRMPSSTVSYASGRARADSRAVNGLDKQRLDDSTRTPDGDDTRTTRNEDIFLNIARSDADRRDSFGRSDLRRSRFRMSGSHLRSPTSQVNVDEQTPSPDQARLNSYQSPLHSQNGSPSTPYTPLPYSYSASAHPLDDHSRSHHPSGFASSSRSVIGLPRSRLSRTSPDASPQSPETSVDRRGSLQDPRAFRHSTLSTIRSSRQTSTSEATERAARYEPDRSRGQDGTESTLSTNAPSTVWDELDDLKSRIKKLELTGKLPPSSQEAIASMSGDRPRTATTTVTTLSSSPHNGRKGSFAESDAPNPVHPLLHSALAKSKTVLSPQVYSPLEATVTDALALSNLLSTGKTPSGSVSVVNGYGSSSSDRFSRRKVDSVCRSLTELCLALSDEQIRKHQAADNEDNTLTLHHKGTNNETPSTPAQQSFSRNASEEPESMDRRQSAPRYTSRLEARRRSSLANTTIPTSADNSPNVNSPNVNNNDSKPQETTKQTQSPASSVPQSRLSRLSTSLRVKRAQNESEDQRSPHARTISRSMTDAGSHASSTPRIAPQPRISHRYTASQSIREPGTQDRSPRYSAQSQPAQSQPQSQSQLPQPRTPTTPSQTNLPLRRSIATPSIYTPATTSRSNIQPASHRYRLSSAASSTVNQNDKQTPFTPQQEPSQTRIMAPSQKLATSYTPIPQNQNRLRTNSLGVRRFGLRRPTVATDNAANSSMDDSID